MMLCECGCGEAAPIAAKTDRRIGAVKGQPARFVNGHQNRSRERSLTPIAERLWRRVEVGGPDECWPWTGYLNPAGYGQISTGKVARALLVHRVAYELAYGPIPDTVPEHGTRWTIDHACHDPSQCALGAACPHRACCNPGHLRLASDVDNAMSGGGICAENALKTHCKHGHPFDAANTYVRKSGARACRTCANENQRRRKARA